METDEHIRRYVHHTWHDSCTSPTYIAGTFPNNMFCSKCGSAMFMNEHGEVICPRCDAIVTCPFCGKSFRKSKPHICNEYYEFLFSTRYGWIY